MEKDLKLVYENIRKIRAMKGLSQEYLCNELNITQKHLSRIENGHVDISLSMLYKIAKALDIKLNVLLGLSNENIYNHIIHTQNGEEYKFYYGTEIEQIQNLYERLLKEKDELIQLQKQIIEQRVSNKLKKQH
jgi:transcriptional regulator with XRE-family HTH domain